MNQKQQLLNVPLFYSSLAPCNRKSCVLARGDLTLKENGAEERNMATSNNPRKFSEKIALHNQKQAEETAAFEEVMKDLSITRAARVNNSVSPLFRLLFSIRLQRAVKYASGARLHAAWQHR